MTYHFIIGHSHGGNIILRALHKSHRLTNEIAGVVCIATPFLRFYFSNLTLALLPSILLRAAEKAWSWSWVYLIGVPVYLAFSIVTLPFNFLFYLITGSWTWDGFLLAKIYSGRAKSGIADCGMYNWIAALIAAAVVTACYSTMAFSTGRKLVLKEEGPKLAHYRHKLMHRFAYFERNSHVERVRILSITSLVDEAFGALEGSWWSHRIGILMARLIAFGIFILGAVAAGGVLYGIAQVDVALRTSSLHVFWEKIGDLFFMVFFVAGLILTLIVAVLVALVGWLTGYLGPGLRLSDPLTNLWISARAYRIPGPWPMLSYRRYGFWGLLRGSRGVLFHSRIYSFPPAIRYIAEWMTETAVRSGQASKFSVIESKKT